MKITTDALRSAIKTTAPAVLAHPQMPLLGGVRITVDDEGVEFATTDHQTWITTRVPFDADLGIVGGAAGSILVSHKLLNQVAGVIRAKEVEFEFDDASATLTVNAGRSVWRCPGMAGEMPTAPEVPKPLAKVEHAELARMVGAVSLAAASESALNPPLHVVRLAAEPGSITLTSTDRHRLHTAELPATGARRKLVTYPEAASFAKVVAGLEGKVTVHADADLFALSDEHTTVVTRTIGIDKWVEVESALKNWRDGVKASTCVPASALADAIRSAQAMLPDDSIGVRFDLSAEEFTISAVDPNSAASARIHVEEYQHEGPGLVAMFRSGLVLPVLALAGDLEVAIDWTKPIGGTLFSVAGEPGTFVVMPLSVPDQGIGWKGGA